MNSNLYLHSTIAVSSSRRSLLAAALGLPLLLAGVGCGGGPDTDSLVSGQQALSTVAVVASFDPSQGQLPESVAADDRGNFYFSMGNTVQRLSASGQLSLYAQLPTSASSNSGGVKFGPDGALYVTSAAFDPTLDAAAVYRVSPRGQVTQLAHLDATGFPNDLAFDDDGNTFVTDPFLGQLWRIDCQGQASVWLNHPLLAGNPQNPALIVHSFGVDGIAFDQDKRNLYVGNFDQGSILRIPVSRSGQPGTPQIFASDARLRGADGIAFDKKENLYVAVNVQDQVAVIDKRGAVSLVAQGGPLDGPSSLVFGTGGGNDQGRHGDDKKTLYIANFAISRAFGLQPGTPHPSLAKVPVPNAGLAIP